MKANELLNEVMNLHATILCTDLSTLTDTELASMIAHTESLRQDILDILNARKNKRYQG